MTHETRRAGGGRRVVRLLFASTLLLSAAAPAVAQWVYVPDGAIEASGVFLTPRDLVNDSGAGPLSAVPVAGLPETSGLAAYEADSNGDTLFVPRIAIELPGPTYAMRQDVVRDTGAGLVLEFDGSAAGVPAGVAIDALARTASGELLLSFDTSVELPGLFVDDEDLVLWNGAGFAPFFDGSTEGVPTALDVDAASYDPVGNRLRLSFDTPGEVGGVSFEDEDLLELDRSSGIWSLAFDGSARDPALAATDIVAVPEPGLGPLLALGAALLAGLGGRIRPERRPAIP